MSIDIQHDPVRKRFTALVDGEPAGFAAYEDAGRVRVFPHTRVFGAHEGKGVGSALVRHALDATRTADLAVRPLCWFVRGWIARHPDYADLVETARE